MYEQAWKKNNKFKHFLPEISDNKRISKVCDKKFQIINKKKRYSKESIS